MSKQVKFNGTIRAALGMLGVVVIIVGGALAYAEVKNDTINNKEDINSIRNVQKEQVVLMHTIDKKLAVMMAKMGIKAGEIPD